MSPHPSGYIRRLNSGRDIFLENFEGHKKVCMYWRGWGWWTIKSIKREKVKERWRTYKFLHNVTTEGIASMLERKHAISKLHGHKLCLNKLECIIEQLVGSGEIKL